MPGDGCNIGGKSPPKLGQNGLGVGQKGGPKEPKVIMWLHTQQWVGGVMIHCDIAQGCVHYLIQVPRCGAPFSCIRDGASDARVFRRLAFCVLQYIMVELIVGYVCASHLIFTKRYGVFTCCA